MNEWISVRKEPPTKSGMYLCHAIIPIAHGGFQSRVLDLRFDLHSKSWVCGEMIVTHWQEMPKLPEVF